MLKGYCAIAASLFFVTGLTTLKCLANANIFPQEQRSVAEVVKSKIDSVVLVVTADENGKLVAEGSGFIVSADGKIITNHHVLNGAHSAVVKLNSGAFFSVDGVLADDADHDLAVIKVAGKNLPYLALSDSDSLSVGDRVLAIGSPLGLQNSVSDGIVSAFRDDARGRSWIQTTAPASHGNSGGPLLIMNGTVAGVLTWKASEGENLNFAVPSKWITPLLAASVPRPFGTVVKSDSTPSTLAAGESIWTSMTSGRDYKVRIEGDYIYVEWINFPQALQSTLAFQRAELKKSGAKWSGKSRSNLPYSYKHYNVEKLNWCRLEVDIEFDSVSDSRIEGRAQIPASFEAKKCEPKTLEWKSFTWIPK